MVLIPLAWGADRGGTLLCETLKSYPHIDSGKLSFESKTLSPLCTPFIHQKSRRELDRCGDVHKDPYTSFFTWASRNEMSSRGKVNLFTDPDLLSKDDVNSSKLNSHVSELRASATNLCCGDDLTCRKLMNRVEVKFCKPSADPNAPDPCVFGGSYKMPGEGYAAIFTALHHSNSPELRQIAARNLVGKVPAGSSDKQTSLSDPSAQLFTGSIVLSSYVPREQGIAAIDPTLLHEFGHACSMVKMQEASLTAPREKALRATQWLDRARSRCQQDLELPAAYYDFWESVGESRELAQCLYNLTADNQKQQVDQPCPALCPGHFLEESVGITFSLLLGNLSGVGGAVFPQTCDHVRDGQHPMVSDVLECLAQNSPRFRERLKIGQHCSTN